MIWKFLFICRLIYMHKCLFASKKYFKKPIQVPHWLFLNTICQEHFHWAQNCIAHRRDAGPFLFPPVIMAAEPEARVGHFEGQRGRRALLPIFCCIKLSPTHETPVTFNPFCRAPGCSILLFFLMHMCIYVHTANLKKKMAPTEGTEPS